MVYFKLCTKDEKKKKNLQTKNNTTVLAKIVRAFVNFHRINIFPVQQNLVFYPTGFVFMWSWDFFSFFLCTKKKHSFFRTSVVGLVRQHTKHTKYNTRLFITKNLLLFSRCAWYARWSLFSSLLLSQLPCISSPLLDFPYRVSRSPQKNIFSHTERAPMCEACKRRRRFCDHLFFSLQSTKLKQSIFFLSLSFVRVVGFFFVRKAEFCSVFFFIPNWCGASCSCAIWLTSGNASRKEMKKKKKKW